MAAPLDIEFDPIFGNLYITDIYFGYDESCSGSVMEIKLK
jgi:hypothetical protein